MSTKRKRTPPARPARPGASRYDYASGHWLVPISDSLLATHGNEWSEPVQLRFEPSGDGWRCRVREAANDNAIDRLVALVCSRSSSWTDYRGDIDRNRLRDAIEAVLSRRD